MSNLELKDLKIGAFLSELKCVFSIAMDRRKQKYSGIKEKKHKLVNC